MTVPIPRWCAWTFLALLDLGIWYCMEPRDWRGLRESTKEALDRAEWPARIRIEA